MKTTTQKYKAFFFSFCSLINQVTQTAVSFEKHSGDILLNFDHICLQFSVFIIWNQDILQLSCKSIAKWLKVQWDLHGEMLSECFRNVFFYLCAHNTSQCLC